MMPLDTDAAELTMEQNRQKSNVCSYQADTVQEDKPVSSSQNQEPQAPRQGLSKSGFIVAYSGLFLAIFANRLSVYSALVYNAYATSSFSAHSLLAAAGVVSDITQICAYPIIAKLQTVFGSAEAFTFAVLFLVIGSILSAACPNIGTYLASGIFTAIGDTSLLLTEQVFIAETTTLANRGLLAAIPEGVTGIVALFVGSIIANRIVEDSSWRWGYGMWAIIVPVCAFPLILVVFLFEKKARTLRAASGIHTEPGADEKNGFWLQRVARFIWTELDLPGAVLLAAGFSILLVPLVLTGSSNVDRWHTPSFIAMLIVGVVLLGIFALWDGKFASKPIVPYRLMSNRTVIAACLIGAFDFLSYSVFTDFFPSYLQVAAEYSPGLASRVTNSLIIAYQASRLLTGLLLRITKRPQIWIFAGVPICILGQGLLIRFMDMDDGHPANQASIVTARVLVGLGRGMYHTASLVSVQALVSSDQLSVATALFLTFMSVGSAIGESIGGAVWSHTLQSNLVKYLPDNSKDQASAIFGSIVVAQEYLPGSVVRKAINQAYCASMRLLAIVATALMSPMIVLMFAMQPVVLP